MSDLSALLDELEQARAKGTAGKWVVCNHFDIVTGGQQVSRGGYTYRYEVIRVDDDRDPTSGLATNLNDPDNPADPEDDAALIVAAVNALPQLTAALRRVEALADEWGALDMGSGLYPEDSAARSAHEDRAEYCAEQIRAALNGGPS